MRHSKLLIVAASILLTLAGVEIFGQAQNPLKPNPVEQPRYQISAGDAATVFAIDTHSGKLWRWTPDDNRFQLLTTIPESKQPSP